MPYKIIHTHKGWFVVNKETGKRKNKKPEPSYEAALRYMRALYAHTHDIKK